MGDNVKFVENAISGELGIELRPSYISKDSVRTFFPEVFR